MEDNEKIIEASKEEIAELTGNNPDANNYDAKNIRKQYK